MTSDDVSRLLASFAALVAVSTVMGMATSEYITLSFVLRRLGDRLLDGRDHVRRVGFLASLPSVTMNFLELAS